ncbi:MAG: hypothetical protein IIC31_05710 [Chloroflexi bacterium]|nr:hypothetical protein [Chloroflexota bacterium]
MAWTSQGPISERNKEKLGESDKGLIMYRRLLQEQMKIVADGGDPMNTFREEGTNLNLYVPNEMEEGDVNWKSAHNLTLKGGLSTGSSGKYSVIGRAQAKNAGLPIPEGKPEVTTTTT